jgi:hypothetical protein
MTGTSRLIASATIGGLMILGGSAGTSAQSASSPSLEDVARVASFPPGSIQGTVQDEHKSPVAGALVTAVGATTIVAVADKDGHFQFRALPPGPYVVRARLAGYLTPPAQVVRVRSTARTESLIALRHLGASAAALPVLAAGFGVPDAPAELSAPGAPGAQEQPAEAGADAAGDVADPTETAWRIRHARRTILKDVAFGDLSLGDNAVPRTPWLAPVDFLGRAAGASPRLATGFFSETPFSGQVNLLTSGSFDAPQQLFSADMLPKGTANVSVSVPAGQRADWTVRGAVTQSDIASWIVAGSYITRVPAVHRYDVGMSYSMQRYDGGNPLALRGVTDGSRNAGEIYAFDTFTLSPAVAATFGARYNRYDYLDHQSLISPRVEVALAPAEHLRIGVLASVDSRAPGAEEFLPPADMGIWLPPQRTFSSLDPNRELRAETTRHAAIDVQRDIASATVGFRIFHQHVNDQLATVFGAEIPEEPVAKLGHYLVANAGNADATGCTASFSAAISAWLRGSVEYSVASASLVPAGDVRYLLLAAPSALRGRRERIHDVSTTLETRVPETATRVIVLYRLSNGFARPSTRDGAPGATGVDGRFDVQVRQSLPFMNFSSARWEMLLAVRNFFHDAADDRSLYDELLVVRPPKRIVGGLTMRF